MLIPPFIGINGIVTPYEVSWLLPLIPPAHSHRLMVGVLASHATLTGKPDRRPGRTPHTDNIASIFRRDARCLNLIHYYTAERDTLVEQLRQLKDLGGSNLHGFQLHTAWPDPTAVHQLRNELGRPVIGLQVGSTALKLVHDDPTTLAERIGEYHGDIDYVMIDTSGGKGKLFDSGLATETLFTLREHHGSWLRLGVSGGIGPSSLDRVEPFTRSLPDLCLIAEGKLRDDTDDHLDFDIAGTYVKDSFHMLRGTSMRSPAP